MYRYASSDQDNITELSEKEQEVLAALSHPNIIRPIDYFTDASVNRIYFVLERAAGR